MPDQIVVNSSPLIVLARAGRIELLTLVGVPIHKQRGLVPSARPLVEEFARAGLYLSEPVVQRALRFVGE